MTPHVGLRVEQRGPRGSAPVVLRRLGAAPPRDVGVDQAAIDVVRQGLFQATHGLAGTSTAVFGNFPVSISGKTGTAEKAVVLPGWSPRRPGRPVVVVPGYGPSDAARLVVCALIENGGHGETAAAPAAALRVFEQFFGVQGSPCRLPEASD